MNARDMRRNTLLTASLAAAGLAAQAAHAQQPYAKPDGSWITLDGTVVEATTDAFTLDYGDGTILVEMDDWDWYGDAYGIIEGDDVTVSGKIDDDFFELSKIEAASVYVDDLNTYFYASAADEESAFGFVSTTLVVDGIDYTGTVSSIDGRQFTLDTGARRIEIDTGEMLYNPLDDKGYQQVDVGDVVRVEGQLDEDFLEHQQIIADTVTTLVNEGSQSR